MAQLVGGRLVIGSHRTERFPRPVKGRARGRDGARQAAVVLAIAAVLAVAAFGAETYVTARQAAAAAAAPGETESRSGSILYMPDQGKICRQVLFDNKTGRFTDNGYVDCDQAASHRAAVPPPSPNARVNGIGGGFSWR